MATPATTPVMKLRKVKSDGTPTAELFDLEITHPETGLRILDEKGKPCVVVVMRPMPNDEWQAILKEKETIARDDLTGQSVRVINHEDAIDVLIERCVASWRGFVGADDQVLVCNGATKLAMDTRVKSQIWRAALGAEVVTAVNRESFRQP